MSKVRDVREYDAVMAMREHTGFGGLKISKRVGIPPSTVDGWIHGYSGYGNPRTRRERWESFGAQPLPATRRCSKCRETKSRRDFYIQFRRATGNAYLSSWCAPCLRAKSEAARKADPEAHRRRNRKAHQRQPRKKIQHRLNAEPFLRYIEPVYGDLPDNEQRRVRRARASGIVTYETADSILARLGHPHAMRGLYGDVE